MKVPESNIKSITALIDESHEREAVARPRPYMGISSIGHYCDRWLWLQFRWAVVASFSGRMLRLFARGQREEDIMVGELNRAGIVLEHTGRDQMEVDLGCFVRGHLDGIILSGVPEAPKGKHVWECKTHNKKSFDELEKHGVKEAKPQHWAQMQCYMLGTSIDRALYTAVCKDDDRIYTERVRFDRDAAVALVRKGQKLATEDNIPAPISGRPDWYKCKFCEGYDFCHGSRMTRQVNCRTCAHFTACEDSTCRCDLYKAEIPLTAQYAGCEAHVLHPDMVPWKFDLGAGTEKMAVYVINGRKYGNGVGGFRSADLIQMAQAQAEAQMTPPPAPQEDMEEVDA